MRLFKFKTVLLVGIFFLMFGSKVFSQNKTYYPFKSEEPVDSRVLWPNSQEIQVWFLIPIAEQEQPDALRGVVKEIIRRISQGELKCYSSDLRCQHMPMDWADYTEFEEALRSKCLADTPIIASSICDNAIMEYYGKAIVGYYTRNPQTQTIKFGKEVGIVGFLHPILSVRLTFSVDLVDIQDIKLKDGKEFNKWFSSLNYFYVPNRIKEFKGEFSICDCQNKEEISNISKTLQTGDLKSIELVKNNFRK
ncbi:MAG: hypothetical protein EBS07_11665, partial [Sphingobacteriia bacterium]|nr:hypothetical protein [Sphingobacteriia bacterium]